MIRPQSIYSDQKQVRSLAGQASGVCYALVPDHHGQGGRHGPVVGTLLDFADRLLSNCLSFLPKLAGGFGSRSFLGSGGALQSALHFQSQHQIIHYIADAVHFLSRLSCSRSESTQHGPVGKVWRYLNQIIRCPL